MKNHTIKNIIKVLKSETRDGEIERAYETLDEKNNYSYKFQKTNNYFSESNYKIIAKDIQDYFKNKP